MCVQHAEYYTVCNIEQKSSDYLSHRCSSYPPDNHITAQMMFIGRGPVKREAENRIIIVGKRVS